MPMSVITVLCYRNGSECITDDFQYEGRMQSIQHQQSIFIHSYTIIKINNYMEMQLQVSAIPMQRRSGSRQRLHKRHDKQCHTPSTNLESEHAGKEQKYELGRGEGEGFLHVAKLIIPARSLKREAGVGGRQEKGDKCAEGRFFGDQVKANEPLHNGYQLVKDRQRKVQIKKKQQQHSSARKISLKSNKNIKHKQQSKTTAVQQPHPNQKLATQSTQVTQPAKQQHKIEKLNLGFRKRSQKSKLKEMMENVLARTKVQEVITIKRSAYQSGERPSTHRSTQQQPRLENSIGNTAPHRQPQTQGQVHGHNSQRSTPQRRAMPPRDPRQKSQLKLPSIKQYQGIVQMVKQEQQQRNKRLQLRHKFTQQGNQLNTEKKAVNKSARMGQSIIEQQIEYSLEQNQSRTQLQIPEQIRQSITVQPL